MSQYKPEIHTMLRYPESEMMQRSEEFVLLMQSRRTIRDFTSEPVSEEIIRNAISAASTAPSGANMQPWHFVAIKDAAIKSDIRQAAEAEERELYEHRASDEWLSALAPLGTDADKPFLETAPWLIAVFSRKYTLDENGIKHKHYYTPESVGIATGMLITALHHAGLGTLTHTPSPMGFLRSVLNRPDSEKPFLLIVTGFPVMPVMVPSISKLRLDEVLTIL
ncbi:MAG: iodotyrosine deiodinase [bacterium]|jgi:iodotyrosine deiodinase